MMGVVEQVRFTIPGEPSGKGRPRFAKIGGFVRAYTPKATASVENLVKLLGSTVTAHLSADERRLPVSASIKAKFQLPKAAPKRKRQGVKDGEVFPVIKKPDGDNIAKLVLDALNGIAYEDDSQVWQTTISKTYSETPCVEVELCYWRLE